MTAPDPVCRTCALRAMSPAARERFLAEAPVTPIHLCDEHQAEWDGILGRIAPLQMIARQEIVGEWRTSESM